jgi:hypothetical protein
MMNVASMECHIIHELSRDVPSGVLVPLPAAAPAVRFLRTVELRRARDKLTRHAEPGRRADFPATLNHNGS